jgi:hypothetical protein
MPYVSAFVAALGNTVKSRYLELEGTEKKVRDIWVFEISEVQSFSGFFF